MTKIRNSPRRDAIANRMQADIIFENEFGIFSGTSSNPFRTNCFSASTDVLYKTEYEATITELLKLKVPEATGMSLDALLDLSRYRLTTIVNAIKQINYQANLREKQVLNGGKS